MHYLTGARILIPALAAAFLILFAALSTSPKLSGWLTVAAGALVALGFAFDGCYEVAVSAVIVSALAALLAGRTAAATEGTSEVTALNPFTVAAAASAAVLAIVVCIKFFGAAPAVVVPEAATAARTVFPARPLDALVVGAVFAAAVLGITALLRKQVEK